MKISHSQRTDRKGVQIVGDKFEQANYIFREQSVSDFGIDAHIEIVDEGRNVTGKLVALQIKSGPSWFREEATDEYVYRGDKEHLSYWLEHSLPVLIVLCDIENRLCYWQAVTPANIISTKTAWKILIPKYQQVNSGMYIDLLYLIDKLPIYKSYTIDSIKDLSHGLAKRYCLRVILNQQHTQAEIVDLVKALTKEAINTEYHRTDLTKGHWKDAPAHVVWLDIFPSAEDERNSNLICQSEWFSTEIGPEDLPSSNEGQEILPNLKVRWNNRYIAMAKLNEENTVSKEDFLTSIKALTKLAEPLIQFACHSLSRFEQGELAYESMTDELITKVTEIEAIYASARNVGMAPYECNDISTNFHSVIDYAHNVYLPFCGVGEQQTKKQVIYNINSQSKYFGDALEGLRYELQKVQ